MFEQVSIVIPVYHQEDRLETLHADLAPIRHKAEILICEEGSRAKSLNAGAGRAQRPFLWFLHADSRVNAGNLDSLSKAIEKNPDMLHYFDLAFAADGPAIARLNAFGANLRSRIFGLPFGDQGFCISKDRFGAAGFYREDLPYGEDLMFVWKARQKGIRLNRIPSKLITSARKYRQHGWLKLTALYQVRWIKMSAPEAFRLIKKR